MATVDELSLHRDIEKRAKEGLAYIWVSGLFLGLLFAWLSLANIPIRPVLEQTRHEHLSPILLSIYYACWIAGCTFDVHTQKWVYLIDPNRSQRQVSSMAVVGMLVGVVAALFYVRDDEKLFSVLLAALWVANVIAWVFLLYAIVLPIIKGSTKHFTDREQYFNRERLDTVAEYIGGRWQIWRFAGMLVIICVLLSFLFIEPFRKFFIYVFSERLQVLSEKAFESIFPDALFFVFIVFAEGVIWYKRFKTRMTLQVIDELDDRYSLSLKIP